MDHPVPLEIEEGAERKSLGVLTGNGVPDEDGFYTLERNITCGCLLPWAVAMGICPSLLNPTYLWDPLAVDDPGMSPLWEAQGVPRLQVLLGAPDLFFLCLRMLWVNPSNLLWGL